MTAQELQSHRMVLQPLLDATEGWDAVDHDVVQEFVHGLTRNANPNRDEHGRFAASSSTEDLETRTKMNYGKLYGATPTDLKPKERSFLERQLKADNAELRGRKDKGEEPTPKQVSTGATPLEHVAHVLHAVKLHGGSYNLAPLTKVREHLADQGITDHGTQTAAIQAATRAGHVTGSGAEGRHGITPEERAASIQGEGGGHPIGYLSLRQRVTNEEGKERGEFFHSCERDDKGHCESKEASTTPKVVEKVKATKKARVTKPSVTPEVKEAPTTPEVVPAVPETKETPTPSKVVEEEKTTPTVPEVTEPPAALEVPKEVKPPEKVKATEEVKEETEEAKTLRKLAEVQEFAKTKILGASVPSMAKVKAYRKKLAEARKAAAAAKKKGEKVPQQRDFLDARGSSKDRKRRAQALFKEFGGETDGYVVCHGTGIKMHWTDDPVENPHGYPKFEQGKIFTATQGGGYQQENLLPESFAHNRSRNDKTLREENL